MLSNPTFVNTVAGNDDDFDLEIAFSSANRMFTFPTAVFKVVAVDGTPLSSIVGAATDITLGGITTRDATYSATGAAGTENRALTSGAADTQCEHSINNVNWTTLELGTGVK